MNNIGILYIQNKAVKKNKYNFYINKTLSSLLDGETKVFVAW